MKPLSLLCLTLILSLPSCTDKPASPEPVISENRRFLATASGDPFFWLSDTGWLLFRKLSREEAETYFDNRKLKGFNVIQAVLIHDIRENTNFYGDTAVSRHRVDMPVVTEGTSPADPLEYDYWDHVDYLVRLAASKGLYLALVPVWGPNVRSGHVTAEQAEDYAAWLAERYRDEPNIIWINGGDVRGSDSTAVWNALGNALMKSDPGHLVTFHPFGRTQSSEWFHSEPWLDFNIFQSGHRRYDQDTLGLRYGEDNWRYMAVDYGKTPVKPSFDGEPSYEGIPQGLHDPSQPYWIDDDVRRYAYWSVFAGGCGFTYGHNAIMQFHKKGDSPAYGVKEYWEEAMDAPGASQLIFLRDLILSRPYFERVPAQEIIRSNGEKYNYIAATRGMKYAFAYTYTGQNILINTDSLGWKEFAASWYDPSDGSTSPAGTFRSGGIITFDPPGEPSPGNDRVLVLDAV